MSFLLSVRVAVLRFLISLLVWSLGGPRAWRCWFRCVAARDWAALGYYCDVVWMDWSWLSARPGFRARFVAPVVRWLSDRLPAPGPVSGPLPF